MSIRPPLNPVLSRELRQRMRGRSAWVVLTLYLVVLAVILRLVYNVASDADIFGGGSRAVASATAGRSIFHWLLFFMLALICFIVPGLTSGAIAGERERQTLVPLQVTLLSPTSIVVGKLLASLSFVLLLVVATLPLVSVSFLLGGVGAGEVLKGIAMVILVAVTLACLALGCSSALRRTQTATVTAYGLTVVLVVGTFVFYGAQRALDVRQQGTTSPAILLVNPFAATAEVVRGQAGSPSDSFSPFAPLQDLLEDQILEDARGAMIGPGGERRLIAPDGPVFVDDGGPAVARFPGHADADRRPRIGGYPFWVLSLGSFVALAGAGFLLAVRRLRVPVRGGSG